MKKLILLAVCLITWLAACDSSDIQTDPSQSMISNAVTQAPNSPQAEGKAEFPHRLDNVNWYLSLSTDEERTDYIRSYFKSGQYAEDHPDFPDVLWIPDGMADLYDNIENNLSDLSPNITHVSAFVLDALEDDEKLGLTVTVAREMLFDSFAAEEELDYFEANGFPAVTIIPQTDLSNEFRFVIIIPKSRYNEISAFASLDSMNHYLICQSGYPDKIVSFGEDLFDF